MGKTKIEWTDYSWPIINGCRRKSAGCENCYAERLAATRLAHTEKYKGLATMTPSGPRWTGETRLWEPALLDPLKIKNPARIFVCDMGDLFYEGVSDEDIDRVFAVMALCPQHTFQCLSKRPERMRDYVCNREGWERLTERIFRTVSKYNLDETLLLDCIQEIRVNPSEPDKQCWVTVPLRNVWLGVSVEDQRTADERIPWLLKTPAAVRFVSYEPVLGPVRFSQDWVDYLAGWDTEAEHGRHDFQTGECLGCPVPVQVQTHKIDWLICGGESGPGARPMHPAWARSVRDQCIAAGVKFFFKQWGAHAPYEQVEHPERFAPVTVTHQGKVLDDPGYPSERVAYVRLVGKKAAGRLLDGREWDEFPDCSTPSLS